MLRGGAGGGIFPGNFPEWPGLQAVQGGGSFRSVASTRAAGYEGKENGGNGVKDGVLLSPEGGRRQFSDAGSDFGDGNRKMEAAAKFFKAVGDFVSVRDIKALKRDVSRQLEILKGLNLNDCQSCEEIALVLEEICKNTEFGDKALEKI